MTPLRLSTTEFRNWLGSARRGNPWVYRAARSELEIAPIVSPLRFDVTIRAAYLRFYREYRELFRSDFEAFAVLAREHEYFVWFKRIACVYWQPHVLTDDRMFAAAWADRLRATAHLYDRFERHGFDSRFPITLYDGKRVLPTETGKRVSREVYAGDGNHRMALLLASGKKTLQPSQYRIKRFRRLIPSDTTSLLLEALDLDEQRYVEFLRAGYPSLSIERVDGHIELAGSPDVALETEVRNLVRIDLDHLKVESH